MALGSFSFSPPVPPLGRNPAQLIVLRYSPGGSPEFQLLPNVLCLGISKMIGPDPRVARFRYVTSQVADPVFPRHFEQTYPIDAQGYYVVQPDDRLVVALLLANAAPLFLFDGFAKLPELQLSRESEMVPFSAAGTTERERDTPIGGAIIRDAGGDTPVDIPCQGIPARFNPDGRGNCTPEDEDTTSDDDASITYPVFFDPAIIKANSDRGRKWTLGNAVRYIIGTMNAKAEYVANRNFSPLEAALSARVPAAGFEFVDVNNPDSWEFQDIICPDYDATGKSWPDAVAELIAPYGFRLAFFLATEEGKPRWFWRILRDDDNIDLKSIKLQPYGQPLNPGATNVGSAQFSRDTSRIANEFVIDGEPDLYEASFILAPNFEIAGADADPANRDKWKEGTAIFDPAKYREFVLDEAGEGHWDFDGEETVSVPPSLDALFGDEDDEDRVYVRRRRIPRRTLFTKDENGVPETAELWIGRLAIGGEDDVGGPGYSSLLVPGLWSREADDVVWQRVTQGGWELLKDRIGIRITTSDAAAWNIGDDRSGGMPFPSGKVNIVKCLASPDADRQVHKPFVFRLTCVVPSDQCVPARADKRPASPTKFIVQRRIDTRDRFRREIVSEFSHFQDEDTAIDITDDTADAKQYAEAYRAADEMARFTGTVSIPRLTGAYEIGDRISDVTGRGVSLRTNIGAGKGESEQYPIVDRIDWSFEAGQVTTLHATDRRKEPMLASRYVTEGEE